ncbi:MAG: hypothetical protein ACKOCW_04345 [Planctomycetaceae bacterium]
MKGFPMRTLLSAAKTVLPFTVALMAMSAVSQAEMITWIDPPATRVVGIAEAQGSATLDVSDETLTRDSIAVLPTTFEIPVAATGESRDTTAEAFKAESTDKAPAVKVKAAIKPVSAIKTGELSDLSLSGWLTINTVETPTVDPYPTWSAATLLIGDILELVSVPVPTLGNMASNVDYRTTNSMRGLDNRRFWGL